MHELHPAPLEDAKRGRGSIIPDTTLAHERLRCSDLHLGLLCLSEEVVSLVLRADQSIHIALKGLELKQSCGLAHSTHLGVWDAGRWFLQCFRPGRPQQMPPDLYAFVNLVCLNGVANQHGPE